MSRLTELAEQVRALNAASGNHIRAIQVAGRKTAGASRSLPSSVTGAAPIVASLKTAQQELANAGHAVAAFGKGAMQFAQTLTSGTGGAGTLGASSLGAHPATARAGANETTVTKYVDPQTGNEFTIVQDRAGRTIRVKANLHDFAGEARTAAEKEASRAVGRSGAPGDEGGHILSVQLAGSLGERNIVPQSFALNRSTYRKFEGFLVRQIQSGSSFQLDYKLLYPSATSTRPNVLRVHITETLANGTKVFRSWGFFNVKGQP